MALVSVASLFAPVFGRRVFNARTCRLTLASAALVVAFAGPAEAQTWTGATSNDWTVGSNWSAGTAPAGGAVSIGPAGIVVLGIQGGATGTAGSVTIDANSANPTSSLTVQNGATLTSTGTAAIRNGATVTVTGAGSQWTANGAISLSGATGFPESLNIENGGTVVTTSSLTVNGANAAATVSGTGSRLQTGNLFVGDTASGSLTIQNGGTVMSLGSFRIGGGSGTGTVTVTGAGSQWTATGLALSVGGTGRGILNVENGATVTASGGVSLGNAGGVGTLNVSNATIASQSLNVGAGSQVNFDNATYRATRSSGVWIGTGPGTLNIAAGGLTLDSVGFTVSALRELSGAGALTKTGTGIVNLTTSNSYTGRTVIDQGTLALRANGSIAASSGVTANGTFDISPLTAAGTDIQSLSGSGVVTMGAKNLTITNASDTFAGTFNGTGVLSVAGGKEILSGDNSAFGGSTLVQGGTLAVNGILAGTMNVQAAGRLQGIGTVGDTINAGIIAPGNSIGTLTVAGNYTGTGGTLQIESVLGGDASPTDLLRVQGNTSGTTSLRVINVGGGGAQTVDGIEVVDVAGTSAGNFALAGDYVLHGAQAVIGGAYAYTLQKNGINTPNDGDWYLRSALINPPPTAPAGPLYAATVPMYEVYSQVLLGLNGLPTLQQRVGNRYWDGAAHSDSDSQSASGIWARVEGRHSEYDADHSTTGSSYDADEFKLQSGLDGLMVDNAFGRLVGGVNFQYGTSSADVRSFYGDGHIHAEGYGFGGTLTWYDRSGFYVDGQARATWFNNDLRSDLVGALQDGNGAFGYAFSLEAGQRVPMSAAWALIPQAQLTYSNVNFDSFTDPFGARVSSNDGDSLDGRLGLALENGTAWRDASGAISRSSLYGIANLYYEFLNGTGATVSGTDISTEGERLWGGLGVGGTYSWADDKYSVYGEVLANTSLESFGDSNDYSATGGIRMKW
ncbi:autotransporter outer membrane beta-barrel domain-containing protein [Hyphomicrobium sp. DY-1]|uniref:autotransporter family protein n=1 Tax=Hyphomicrobium sp. DY-1 TaxID=3075650 RepID=UPI0039C1E3B3